MKTFRIILPGLLVAQIIATLQVYISDIHLSLSLDAIKSAGYFAVPNQYIVSGLRELSTAFFGGMFFTFSAGVGISLLAFLAAWVWDRIFSRNKLLLIPFLVLWIWVIAEVNSHGVCLIVSSYFFVIPPIVFTVFMRRISGEKAPFKEAACSIPLLLLALLWTLQMGTSPFQGIRDVYLLSNSFGAKINDFYYAYTLYPAEVFKTQEQKMLKTYRLENASGISFMQSLERTLEGRDYLYVEGYDDVDLTIKDEGNGTLLFKDRGKTILTTSLEDFLLKPSAVLQEFSAKTDRYAFFRQFTFFSILMAFPILLYIVTYTVIHRIFRLFLDTRDSVIITSIICFFIGVAFLLPLVGIGKNVNTGNLSSAMESGQWRNRVAALKTIQQKRLDISAFGNYRPMLTSQYAAERYWLADALGYSRKPEAYRDLLVLLDDPSPNVVCKAFEALGRRGDRHVVPEIMKRIEASDHWYEQWYAYKTLRTLGWKQTRSK
ncbi:MAG TPA: HEAT repeat domain-containing protein [Syntrophales bacterium]|nr:HEAT repeat domain-containing protein [Syntrophales bacterium]HPQ43911.1 HEAT repeat domain-containing protein [Syntrophales bacterium]